MKALLLSQGIFCLLDDNDYEWLHHWKWSVVKKINPRYAYLKYARRKGFNPTIQEQQFIYLHRIIGGTTKDFIISFRDKNPLNLQRKNICIKDLTGKEILWRGSCKESRYQGIKWDSYYGLWRAQIKGLIVGYFVEEMSAVMEYNKKVVELYGDKARVNRIENI